METKHLRDLVEQRVGVRWDAFARAHPHLAAAIDRTRLIETAVERLRDDPAFQRAMSAAGADEARLSGMERVAKLVEALVARMLPAA